MPMLTVDLLCKIFTVAPRARVERFFQPLMDAMAGAEMDTPLRQAHFLAQVAHESGELRYTEEIASGAAYEGRADLGNVQEGDGVRFKGRGLLQVTGRANYAAFAACAGVDVVADPMLLASDAGLAAKSAAWFWRLRGLNLLADADDGVAITRKINGGLYGMASRTAYLAVAKRVLLPEVVARLHAVEDLDWERQYRL